MRAYGYWRDPLFLTGCAAYAVNSWLIRPHMQAGFSQMHFNDLWLIPCALPPVLWLHRKFGLRSHDQVPQFLEVVLHLIFWSVLFEWIGPLFLRRAVGDPMDVVVYTLGALLSMLWWHREAVTECFLRP